MGFSPPASAQETSVALPGYDPGKGITKESVREIMEWAMKEYDVPAAAIVVVKDGQLLLAEGFGERRIGTGEKVDADTLFQLASVSKTFTAAATAGAVDREKLEWQQPASEVIPGFEMAEAYPTKWANSVDCLVHRAGYPKFFGDAFDHLGYSRDEVLHRLRFVKPAYSFRDHPEYSNLGFFLAGEVTARALGTTYEEAVESILLEPLAMKSTGVAKKAMYEDKAANAAMPHALRDGKPAVIPPNTSSVFVAAGGWASSANDLANYTLMLLNEGSFRGKEVLSKDSLERMLEPVIASEVGFSEFPPIGGSSGFDYSPGWGAFHYNGQRVYEKGGALDGFRAVINIVPEEKFGVAVLANMNLTALPEAVRAGLLQQLYGRPGEEDLQPEIKQLAEKLSQMVLGAKAAGDGDPAKPARPLDDYSGSYTNDLYGIWKLAPGEGGVLDIAAGPAEYAGTMKPTGDEEFNVTWPIEINSPVEVEFEVDDAGRPYAFTYLGYRFRRLTPTE